MDAGGRRDVTSCQAPQRWALLLMEVGLVTAKPYIRRRHRHGAPLIDMLGGGAFLRHVTLIKGKRGFNAQEAGEFQLL